MVTALTFVGTPCTLVDGYNTNIYRKDLYAGRWLQYQHLYEHTAPIFTVHKRQHKCSILDDSVLLGYDGVTARLVAILSTDHGAFKVRVKESKDMKTLRS
jgi:hypothetical protein